MAYFTQERKKQMSPKIKEILKRYNLKGSLSVRHHSTVVLNIRSGKIDFISNNNDCNKNNENQHERTYLTVHQYGYQRQFSGTALNCLIELFTVLLDGNHDNSDIMTDYFDVGWYVDLNIGEWDTPYICC
jgi:hypothetical protein